MSFVIRVIDSSFVFVVYPRQPYGKISNRNVYHAWSSCNLYASLFGQKDNLLAYSLPKAILCDMDDTILAYSQNADHSWRTVGERFAGRFPHLSPETIVKAIKASSTEYWSDAERHRAGRLNMDMTRQKIIADALASLGIDDQTLALEMALAYAAHREDAITPFPGALETLRELRKRNVRLALLTNGSATIQRRRVEKHALTFYFDYILIEGEFGVGKPDRRVYLHALEQLSVTAEEAWMVG